MDHMLEKLSDLTYRLLSPNDTVLPQAVNVNHLKRCYTPFISPPKEDLEPWNQSFDSADKAIPAQGVNRPVITNITNTMVNSVGMGVGAINVSGKSGRKRGRPLGSKNKKPSKKKDL